MVESPKETQRSFTLRLDSKSLSFFITNEHSCLYLILTFGQTRDSVGTLSPTNKEETLPVELE